MSRANMTTPQLKYMRESALDKATRVARNFFGKRGNHSEAHVAEGELVAILAVAFELGAEWRHGLNAEMWPIDASKSVDESKKA